MFSDPKRSHLAWLSGINEIPRGQSYLFPARNSPRLRTGHSRPRMSFAIHGEGLNLRSLSLCLIFSFLAFSSARAVEPRRHISQYAHTAWRIQDGFFSGVPNAITQTKDGYLWIGTEAGLVRFDGVRFVPWIEPEGKHLPQPAVYSLLGAADGSLWIGTGGGLAHWINGDLINYSTVVGRVKSIREDQQGKVWIARSRFGPVEAGSLCGIEGSETRCYGAADGLKCAYGSELVIDEQGNFWIGSSDALCRWKLGSSSTYLQRELKEIEGLVGVAGLAAGRDGVLWAGIPRTGRSFGLRQFANGAWTPYIVPGLNGTDLAVNTLLLDRHNALWVGTVNQGIYRVYDGKADQFSSSDGLSSNSVEQFYEDREGNVWVATSMGIDCFRDARVATFSVREGLTADGVSSVLGSRDGTVWIGNQGALDVVRQGALSKITAQNGMPGQDVTSLFEDHSGRLWVGADQELAVYEHKRFRSIKRSDGSPVGVVVAMTEDTDNNIWASVVGKGEGLIRIRDLKLVESVATPPHTHALALAPDPRSGIWLGLRANGLARYRDGRFEAVFSNQGTASDPIFDLLVDSDGAIWGATNRGLIRWKEARVETLTSRNGVPCDSIYALVRDNIGSLWLSTKCGFVAITDSELAKWRRQADSTIRVKVYDAFDGAQPGHTSFRPAASMSADGRLWFANDSSLQMIDPGRLDPNDIPPPVRIEQIVADKNNYSSTDKLRLPPLTRDLEIDYTALSFRVPRKVRFRYKLEGHDADWQDPQTRRQAFYTDLRPGHYRFRVIACNNDGVWNEQGATLDLFVAPAWYQTNWFLRLCFVTGIFLLWALYALRVRHIERSIHARFDERLAERTRMAREFHDTLLQTIQGSKMVADDALDDSTDLPRMRRAMERLSGWLGEAMQEGRTALNALRTSTTQTNDLAASFQRALDDCRIQGFPEVVFVPEGTAAEMHPIVRDEIYRIGYEAIRNACQHSGASRLEVRLSYLQDLALSVSDNGRGIASNIAAHGKDGHYGLQGMRERAVRISGKLSVASSANSGTTIELIVPGRIVFRAPRSGWLTLLTRMKGLFEGPDDINSAN